MREKLTEEERKARRKAYNAERYAKNRWAMNATTARYRAEHRAVVKARDVSRNAMPERKAYMKEFNAKLHASPEGQAYSVARAIQFKYGRAALFVADLLFRFQSGKCYLSGEPLVTPTIDHDHATDLIRGLTNASANLLLGQHCGDSVVGCRQRLARLKDKNGKLGTFIKNAIPALMHTPMMQMGLSYRVTGSRASLTESRTNKGTIERANMLALGACMDRINNEMENAA